MTSNFQEPFLPQNGKTFDEDEPVSSGIDDLWHGEPVPAFAADPGIVQRLGEWTLEKRVPNAFNISGWGNYAASKAWKYSMYASSLVWLYWAVSPVFVYFVAECDHHHQFAHAPAWTLFLYVPIVAAAMFFEIRAHSYMLPVHVRALGGYTIGPFKVPFPLWFFGALFLGVGSHMDLATSGIFVARLVKTASCPVNEVQDIWNQTVQASAMRFLPSLATLSVILWVLMLPQLVLCLGYGWPFMDGNKATGLLTRKEPLSEDWTSVNRSRKPHSGTNLLNVNTAFSGKNVKTINVVACQADAGRMMLLNFRRFNFFIRTNDRMLISRQRGAWTEEMFRMASKAAVSLLLESSLQLNLQISVLALGKALTGRMDPLTTFSVISGVWMACFNLYTMATQVLQMGAVMQDFLDDQDAFREKLEKKANVSLRNKTVIAQLDEVERLQRSLFRAKAVLASVAVPTLWLLGYAAMKLMAAVVCKDGMWNVSGCVQLSLNDA